MDIEKREALKSIRETVSRPPKGIKEKLKWYGPALLWMLSSVGSGSVLFTPRVGSRYGYALLWAALLVIFIQWVSIKEVGRFTTVTGRTLLEGFKDIPGPANWAIWLIFLPQLAASVVTVSGIASLAGSALIIALPGSHSLYAASLIIISVIFVLAGKYKGVENISTILGGVLILAALISAAVVFKGTGEMAAGLVPGIPQNADINFILPWLGFILAGAIGIIWFSYWTTEKGYGRGHETDNEIPLREKLQRLKDWKKIMTTTATIGIAGGGLVVISFLILGAEILRPEGIVPEGIKVAEDLTKLLSSVWGPAGRWIVLIGIFVALFGTILTNQDGWGRTFSDITIILTSKKTESSDKKIYKKVQNRSLMAKYYSIIFTAVLPLILFFIVRDPVDILSVAGGIAAIHTPVVVFLTLYINTKFLPEELRPGKFMRCSLLFSGLFFTAVAVLYFMSILGIL